MSGVRAAPQAAGFVLFPTLVVLVLVAFLVATSMQGADRQESIARSQADRAESFEAGQSALQSGESWLGDQTVEPSLKSVKVCQQPCVIEENGLTGGGDITETSFWQDNGNVGDISDELAEATGQYFVEYRTFEKDTIVYGQKRDQRHRDFYRVIAFGEGSADKGAVVIESVFAKRFR